MRYWHEMFQNKRGFNDGESVPPDAEILRTLYVLFMNRELKRLKSKLRVFAYDRPGFHNPYLILHTTVSAIKRGNLSDDDLSFVDNNSRDLRAAMALDIDDFAKLSGKEADLFELAVENVFEMEVDSHLVVSFRIADHESWPKEFNWVKKEINWVKKEIKEKS